MKRKGLSKFEELARQLVEGSFKRLFGGQIESLEVATQLARVVEDMKGDAQIANQFHIQLHPADYDALMAQNPALSDELSDYLLELSRQAALSMSVRPTVILEADLALPAHEIRISTHLLDKSKADTTQVHQLKDVGIQEILAALYAVDAYLIVGGRRHIGLDKPITLIGRRMDNDIVLDSAGTSRRHAQIRWRYGRFILYDLSNRRRTFVNGQSVKEHVLQAGDVITLGEVMLIYGEGKTAAHPVIKSEELDEQPTQLKPRTRL